MLLKRIVEQLDAELHRLKTLRQIVARLQGPAVVLTPSPAELQEAPAREREIQIEAASDEIVVEKRRTAARRRSGGPDFTRKPKRMEPVLAPQEPTALTSAIPAGPVVVSAEALARERSLRRTIQSAGEHPDAPSSRQSAEDAEAIARSLASRWLQTPLVGSV